MSSRLLSVIKSSTWPSCHRCQLQSFSGFHSSAVVASSPKRGPIKVSYDRNRFIPKGAAKSRLKTTSRTRLVKDLKSDSTAGKYEVAKTDSNARAKDAKTSDSRVSATEQKPSIQALLDEEFDRSTRSTTDNLPNSFTSPPLLPTLAQSIADVLGPVATPTPIQGLALKHMFSLKNADDWKQFLLASETGSGKSFAYLLPLIQYLKETEETAPNPPSSLPINPRALVLAPTHELTRQLSVFAKSLTHYAKLRVLCASRTNALSSADARMSVVGSARQMKHLIEHLDQDSSTHDGQLEVHPKAVGGPRSIDVLVSTSLKALEMVHGWGWQKVGKKEFERDGKAFRPGKSEMGLQSVECIVVDEADVLFDPDFRETTLNLLSDISAARGHPIPANAERINYPFHLILTSATIPAMLSTYLSTHHPTLTRLASPNLHRLPSTLQTEYVTWTGGNRFADVEKRLRRVWTEDALRGPNRATGRVQRSRVIIFCNRSTTVDALGAHLSEHGIPNVTLTSTGASRGRGSNRHLSGFLKDNLSPRSKQPSSSSDDNTHVLITTSLLSRGLDFSPSVKHVFIVDSPRNMIDFLHRAGRSGRAGQQGKVVVFGKLQGRGSGVDVALKSKVSALARR